MWKIVGVSGLVMRIFEKCDYYCNGNSCLMFYDLG